MSRTSPKDNDPFTFGDLRRLLSKKDIKIDSATYHDTDYKSNYAFRPCVADDLQSSKLADRLPRYTADPFPGLADAIKDARDNDRYLTHEEFLTSIDKAINRYGKNAKPRQIHRQIQNDENIPFPEPPPSKKKDDKDKKGKPGPPKQGKIPPLPGSPSKPKKKPKKPKAPPQSDIDDFLKEMLDEPTEDKAKAKSEDKDGEGAAEEVPPIPTNVDRMLDQWEDEGSPISRAARPADGLPVAVLSGKREHTSKVHIGSMRQSLIQLMNKMGEADLQGDPSPRIRPGKLVKELLLRRSKLSKTRREEIDQKFIVLAVDTSPSCKCNCAELLRVCESIADHHDKVVVVSHYNGSPRQVDDRNYPGKVYIPNRLREEDEVNKWWEELLTNTKFQGMIAFGDWDAAYTYALVTELGVPFYLLDSEDRRLGVAPAPPRYRRQLESAYGASPTSIMIGVSDAESTAYALRELVRGRGG